MITRRISAMRARVKDSSRSACAEDEVQGWGQGEGEGEG